MATGPHGMGWPMEASDLECRWAVYALGDEEHAVGTICAL